MSRLQFLADNFVRRFFFDMLQVFEQIKLYVEYSRIKRDVCVTAGTVFDSRRMEENGENSSNAVKKRTILKIQTND